MWTRWLSGFCYFCSTASWLFVVCFLNSSHGDLSHVYSQFELLWLIFFRGTWTMWLITAIAAAVVGVMYRYYMFEPKSSWVLAFCFHPILFIWRPWNIWPKPPHTECTRCPQQEQQFDVLLSSSVYIEHSKYTAGQRLYMCHCHHACFH